MAKFQLNTKSLSAAGFRPHRTRIGFISLFALVIIICLAVLAVLAFSTANASLVMSERQATATTELYLNESAAQEFLAGIDEALSAGGTASGKTAKAGAQAVEAALDSLVETAQAVTKGESVVTASVDGDVVNATFACENGRVLTMSVILQKDGSYRIDQWKMHAVQNEEEPTGQLYIID